MHALVPRDAAGRSDYRLAAIRPSQIGLADDDVTAFVDGVAERDRRVPADRQLQPARTRSTRSPAPSRGLEVLEKRGQHAPRRVRRQGRVHPGARHRRAVPLDRAARRRAGLPRAPRRSCCPTTIDPAILAGRYVPNLVPRPFAWTAPSSRRSPTSCRPSRSTTVLADFDAWAARPGELCRVVLIELLAWQFASPVRWIETQDLFFTPVDDGGLGVERFIEIGVGQSPTVANLAVVDAQAAGPLRSGPVEVLNIERDNAAVVLRPTRSRQLDEDEAPEAAAAEATARRGRRARCCSGAAVGRPASGRPDLRRRRRHHGADRLVDQDAPRPDRRRRLDRVAVRRRVLAPQPAARRPRWRARARRDRRCRRCRHAALSAQVKGLARGYKPFGPVLSEALGDHLKKVLGPTGKRQAAIAERVTDVWQLGAAGRATCSPSWRCRAVTAPACAAATSAR